MKVSLVIVLVCLVFCARSHFTRSANAEQVNFKNYSDDELVDKGYGPIIHGGGGTIYIDETRSDPRYQIEMIRRLKNAVQDLNKTMLESRGVLKELDRNIKSSDATLKNSDNTLRDLNKNLIKFSTETSLYSNILIGLTIVLFVVTVVQVVFTIWQVKIAKRLGRQANLINNQKDTAPDMSREPSKAATESDTTERKGDVC
ncbi:MAG: hypothetical protein NT096_09760 [Proteobacteria bacterium]|nr:hypothetical protein [Pseudomonadota bacterium]